MQHVFRVFAAIAVFGFAATFGAVAASAQTIEAVTADQLEAALDAAGLNPSMMEDAASGAPVAQGKAGEFSFYVRAMNCSGEPQSCEDLVFFANFDLRRAATTKDYRVLNSFNESQVFGRAYLIEANNEVGIDYVVELGGGVTPDHLAQNIGRWADVITAFVAKFQEGYSGS